MGPTTAEAIDRSLRRLVTERSPDLHTVTTVDGVYRFVSAAIIDLCHALGMGVVAEGVETQAQLDQLVTLGCDRAQGFLFATAGPPSVIEDRVRRGVVQLDLRRHDDVLDGVRPVAPRQVAFGG